MATAAPEIPVLARDQAFETLYRSYVKDVYHYALALLRNPADAEDVTQTTFLNAYRAFQRGIEVEKPQNWLIRIAHNVARTRYARASRRVKEVPLEDHVEQLAVPESDRPDVTGVLRALGRLPFNQRAALVMRELEGRPYAEIADTIGVSVSAVEALIFRARKSLRIKASALRVLGVVPLPGSLTGFFEGGGVIAGGGAAAVGTGFLVKAAVALIAGALATGIGSDHGSGTDATAALTPRLPLPESLRAADGFMGRLDSLSLSVKGARLPAQGRRRAGGTAAAAGTKLGARLPVEGVTARPGAQVGSSSSETSTSGSPAGVPIEVPSDVSNQVSTVAGTVQNAAAAATPALPVQAPSLPPVGVDVPPVPPPPPLP
jgi:RNA polymerase sigma factor (sigma-70 family)